MTNYGRPELLVSSEWLQAHLNDPNLRVVDTDPLDAYKRVHIPGAVPVKDNFWKDPETNRRFVMTPEQFAAEMAAMGIGDDTLVVAYDAGSTTAGRLWWCLNYYGHTQARVLDGGWNVWLKEGRPLTREEPKLNAATFTPRRDESLLATAEQIMAKLEDPGVVVLDVRSDGEWDGTNLRGNKRGGKIPGSVHIEWVNNLTADDERRFKSAAELRAMFEAQGVTPDKEVITFCQGGIRAAQAAFTLKLLGYEKVRNYDGSFGEWGNRDDTPIA
ncbi:MAG TPA: sulfurtransferase [Dehalococcoidia bacterium]|nr:sulfurtransferase [Dehalococcoidia bacterium]